MIVYPAIDLLNGQCVRLEQGDYQKATVYHSDALAQAQIFKQAGATWLHVVDLEAAKSGQPAAADIIRKLVRESGLKIQTGGGIRNFPQAARLLDEVGVARIILGTAAVRDPDLVSRLIDRYGPARLAIGLDARDGEVSLSGWTSGSGRSVHAVAAEMSERGVRTVIYTDIARDGMLTGPALAQSQTLIETFPELDVICSGGIARVEDIAACHRIGAAGVISGKALYAGKIKPEDLWPETEKFPPLTSGHRPTTDRQD